MVLTAAQTTVFFENADQMAIPNATVLQLVAEGINTVDDLSEFDKDTIQQIASNLRRPLRFWGQVTKEVDSCLRHCPILRNHWSNPYRCKPNVEHSDKEFRDPMESPTRQEERG